MLRHITDNIEKLDNSQLLDTSLAFSFLQRKLDPLDKKNNMKLLNLDKFLPHVLKIFGSELSLRAQNDSFSAS